MCISLFINLFFQFFFALTMWSRGILTLNAYFKQECVAKGAARSRVRISDQCPSSGTRVWLKDTNHCHANAMIERRLRIKVSKTDLLITFIDLLTSAIHFIFKNL